MRGRGRTALLSQEDGAVVFLAALVEDGRELGEKLFAVSDHCSIILRLQRLGITSSLLRCSFDISAIMRYLVGSVGYCDVVWWWGIS